ncbi:IS1096 element passenger TnpR family protein [Paractinoplanes durhamensis]|uniref:Plasmid pRiA4b Orf3-like domain-containing protein n=1 Tax=Paractinoplanes durhamensis TaxID=113563 RepID=A0ABQ3YWU4_9ACTN|nr:SEC-C metal-binding domain-containing protein [Actinoplanes durhamensis]GIE02067.1 hypothetical protein Adu01nite_34170 [Actinoplanes durhamensis]
MSIRQVHQMAYFPPASYEQVWERDLLDATSYRDHTDYRREVEQQLQAMSADGRGPMRIIALDVPGLLTYAERTGQDPASRQTRLGYVNALGEQGADTVAWPPERNAACWCGSGRKYKRCCAAPWFLAIEPADPASLVLTVEVDKVTPRVWRRVAIPSNTTLDQVHRMLQDALGWSGEQPYAFRTDGYTIVDPRSAYEGIAADQERLVSVATEIGDRFTYLHDLGERWSHTVTLDEIRPGGPDNVLTHLTGGGPCPPGNIGGAHRYQRLLTAFTDQDDPHHAAAVDILGADFDPTAAVDPGKPETRQRRAVTASVVAQVAAWAGDTQPGPSLGAQVRQAMGGLFGVTAASDDVVYAEAEAFRKFGDDAHPLDVEIHTAQLLYRFEQEQPSGSFGLAMGAFTLAARSPQPHVAAFVAAVNHLLPGMASHMALADLARQGILPPAWAERLGDVEPRRAWRYRDAFGDQEALLVTFSYDDAEHGILVEIVTCPTPMARVVHLSGTVDALRDVLQRSADDAHGQVTLEAITLDQAYASLTGPVQQPHPDMTPQSLAWLPIVAHRVGLLPEPEPVDPARSTRAERAAAVETFLADTAPLPGVGYEVLRFWAQVLAGYTGTDGSAPTRIGPVWLGHVLGEHVPRAFELTPAQRSGLAAAVTAWARWATRQQGLPTAAADLLAARIAEIDEAFDRVYADLERTTSRSYLSDITATTADGEDLRRVFALRTTAVPLPRHGSLAEQALRVSDPADRHRILTAVLESWELAPGQSVLDWIDALVSVSDQLWNPDTDLARETMDFLDLVGSDSELLGDLTELALEHGHDTTGYHEASLDRVTPDPEDFD